MRGPRRLQSGPDSLQTGLPPLGAPFSAGLQVGRPRPMDPRAADHLVRRLLRAVLAVRAVVVPCHPSHPGHPPGRLHPRHHPVLVLLLQALGAVDPPRLLLGGHEPGGHCLGADGVRNLAHAGRGWHCWLALAFCYRGMNMFLFLLYFSPDGQQKPGNTYMTVAALMLMLMPMPMLTSQ